MPCKRLLLKLSGEALSSDEGILNHDFVSSLAKDIVTAVKGGQEVAIVVGGGNIIRGASAKASYLDRVTADHMGIIATMINALALRDALQHEGGDASVMSALSMPAFFLDFNGVHAKKMLSEKKIVIFAAGTGKPFVTTDTAASLRAVDIGADVLLKATKVDGIYSADPRKDKNAQIYKFLSFDDVIAKKLEVMDLASFQQCRDHNIPIRVFNLFEDGALLAALQGKNIGSLIAREEI